MEGISKELLTECFLVAKVLGNRIGAQVLSDLIDQCTELTDQQWQTIDEFKVNPVDGWCFLIHSRFNHRTMGNHSLGRFWIDGGICKEEHITHVMPIKTPEAPK